MTNLIRWNPYAIMEKRPLVSPLGLLEEVEEIARKAFEDTLFPRVQMHEEDKELVIKANLPGFRKKDLSITMEDGVLAINAEKAAPKKKGKAERNTAAGSYGHYTHCMTLPSRVDEENITATFKKGMLEIKLPKAETPPARQIEIKTK